MEEENKLFLLDQCIQSMQENMELLKKELEKANKFTLAARRSRMLTLKLSKTFKSFRKISCEAGLK
jgi:hypothetical protein